MDQKIAVKLGGNMHMWSIRLILIISFISSILLGCNKSNSEFFSKPVKVHYIETKNIERSITTEKNQELFDEV